MWRPGDPTGASAIGSTWADSDALLATILGALTVGVALAGVGLYTRAPDVAVEAPLRAEVRSVPAPPVGATGGGQVRVALIGAGPVPLSAIAPVGAFDVASGVLVSPAPRSADLRAAISTT